VKFINVQADVILSNDITAPIAIKEFRKIGVKKVFDPKKNRDGWPTILSRIRISPPLNRAKFMREFALEQGIMFFDVGQMGIEHCLLPEKGIVLPGDVVIGADSHTCTYGGVRRFCDRYGFHRYCHGDGHRRHLDESTEHD